MVIKELGPKDWMEKMMRQRAKMSLCTNDIFELEQEFDKLFMRDEKSVEFDEFYFCELSSWNSFEYNFYITPLDI